MIMLYYLTQNADFEKTVKPLMASLKDSEQMLGFLKELSKFSDLFSAPPNTETKKPEPTQDKKEDEKKEKPSAPTDGFANDFIRECLEKYFRNS